MPTPNADSQKPEAPWRRKLHDVLFEAETFTGKLFDVCLLLAILLSILAVMLESVDSIDSNPTWHRALIIAEWFFTILFTIEYILRLLCVARPARYAKSFFGVVDLLSILPTYVSIFLPGAQSLMTIRILRLLRIFRIFKLGRMLSEAAVLRQAFWQSRAKIIVFLTTVITIVAITGAMMHLLEGEENGAQISSIPEGMYWAIVTMATVGYGDIVPVTTAGKILSSILILVGYSLIIVPTGIVSAELVNAKRGMITTQSCRHCMGEGHDADAKYCKYCGKEL